MKFKSIFKVLIFFAIAVSGWLGVGSFVDNTANAERTSRQQSSSNSQVWKNLEIPITNPSIKAQQITHLAYTTSWNPNWLEPNWVAYALTKEELKGNAKRESSFSPDPDVIGTSAEHKDYTKSGYSRGHMAPAADMKWSEQAMHESFYLSNVCPQRSDLNEGPWERLENKVRQLAKADGVVYVCCGPIMTKRPKTIGKNRVAVPSKFFKVICRQHGGKWYGVGFIMPNDAPRGGSMYAYACTIDEVERITGHNFFSLLPDNIEKSMEAAPFREADWQ